MKTLKLKKVGEFQIFNGLDQLTSDPEMTRIANKDGLSKLQEQIAVNEKTEQQQGFLIQKTEAKKKVGRFDAIIKNKLALLAAAKNPDELNLVKIEIANAPQLKIEAQKKVDEHSVNCLACESQLKILNTACDKKRKEYTAEHLIYSHPPAGQIGIYGDLDIEALKTQYENLENQQIVIESKTIQKEVHRTIDESITAPFLEYVGHSVIEDFIGKQYFYKIEEKTAVPLADQPDVGKWTPSETITELGVTVKTVVSDDYYETVAIEKSDLTPEQSEEIRIQKLTPEQLATEIKSLQENALTKSGQVMLEMQIIGEVDPLGISQEYYAAENNVIQEKYA